MSMIVAAFLAVQPLVFADRVALDGGAVRLSDVADLSGLPIGLKQRAAGLVVARVETGETVLSSRRMASRARALMPGLSPWLPEAADTAVRIESRAPSAIPPATLSVADATPMAAVQAVRTAAAPRFVSGDRVTISTQVGPVSVEREVRALQDGWPGRTAFVRTDDGHVLAARVAEAP